MIVESKKLAKINTDRSTSMAKFISTYDRVYRKVLLERDEKTFKNFRKKLTTSYEKLSNYKSAPPPLIREYTAQILKLERNFEMVSTRRRLNYLNDRDKRKIEFRKRIGYQGVSANKFYSHLLEGEQGELT